MFFPVFLEYVFLHEYLFVVLLFHIYLIGMAMSSALSENMLITKL